MGDKNINRGAGLAFKPSIQRKDFGMNWFTSSRWLGFDPRISKPVADRQAAMANHKRWAHPTDSHCGYCFDPAGGLRGNALLGSKTVRRRHAPRLVRTLDMFCCGQAQAFGPSWRPTGKDRG